AELRYFLGVTDQTSSHKEKLISGLGAFLGIFSVCLISLAFMDQATAVYIVPSIGASAVLLFAAPHVSFSQPWNVFAGHLVSAVVGVSCALIVSDAVIAASLAVGIAVTAMYYLRCIHPPGGATALAAVIGSAKLHNLGYSYILTPVFLNVVTLLLIALLFNLLFNWRRYPAYLHRRLGKKDSVTNSAIREGYQPIYQPIRHEDFVYALSQMDSFVDISEADLLKIYSLATGKERH
ncbi:MAG: HPP family protein, partial [Thiotrichaceae bacterium]